MKNYAVMNLTMISRLAVLENAQRTGKAIDCLVSILRYESDVEKSISTVGQEVKIIEKMFELHKLRKGPGFLGVINNNLKQDKCYIKKGKLVAIVDVAISKKLGIDKDSLEVIVSIERKDGQVNILIKDNGDIYENEQGESLDQEYLEMMQQFDEDTQKIKIKKKPGIGTTITLHI